MPILKHQNTKSLTIRPNGRSADFVTPNFIYGCAGGCRNSYCYVMRYNYENIYINDNLTQILTRINDHAAKLSFPKPANQTDAHYWTYDIGCSTDICLHWKQYDWLAVFDFFKTHPRIKATFATKYVNPHLLTYNAERKIRVRLSLMPQAISSILEPHTSLIEERILAIKSLITAGYEVHINFSPIVVYDTWLEDYAKLFKQINQLIPVSFKPNLLAECIFMTHNLWQHERNLSAQKFAAEELLWKPAIQETKISNYGSEAVRYHHLLKSQYIKQWQTLHDQILPWNTIRYIF